MFDCLIKHRLAPIVMLSVILLFLFPAAHGGFQASHGPTSTLKESVLGLLLQVLLLISARRLAFHGWVAPLVRWLTRETCTAIFARPAGTCPDPLRC